MSYNPKQHALIPVLAGLMASSFVATVHADSTVFAGWDLFQTVSAGTTFNGMNWMGVPLGTFDFGGAIGVQNVDGTDTIVHRLAAASAPSQTIPIELVALQLEGVQDPSLFLTLQSVRGGPASTGTMTINFGAEGDPHGTFDSSFDVFFDVRSGGLNGPIVQSGDLQLGSVDNLWRHAPQPGVVIDGVNHDLNGKNILNDFWPAAQPGQGGAVFIFEKHPGGSVHEVTFPTPENGASLPLLLIPLVSLGWYRFRRSLDHS